MADLRELEINAFLSRAEMLAQLSSHPGWETWLGLLHEFRQAALEELARCTEPGEFRYWQGAAAALAEITERPARIAVEADRYQVAEQADKHTSRPELRAIVGAGLDADGDV